MTIRYSRNRRGLSLVELAFALLVIGAVLAVVWEKAASVYQDYYVSQAGRELAAVVGAVRAKHTSDKITANEDIDVSGLPPELVGHFNGHPVVFNPWRGRISLFPGNAMGWGIDTYNPEFTLQFDGVPSSDCTDFAMLAASPQMRSFGLVSVYISPSIGVGQEICLATDAFCKNIVPDLTEKDVKNLCNARSRMTVMLSYTLR